MKLLFSSLVLISTQGFAQIGPGEISHTFLCSNRYFTVSGKITEILGRDSGRLSKVRFHILGEGQPMVDLSGRSQRTHYGRKITFASPRAASYISVEIADRGNRSFSRVDGIIAADWYSIGSGKSKDLNCSGSETF